MKNNTEKFIGESLRWGVIISAVVIGFGLLMYFATGQTGYVEGSFPTEIGAIFNGLIALKPFAIIDFGLILLILTPVLRVVVSIFTSIAEKDTTYIWINTYVLFVLALSLFLGRSE